MVGLQRALGMKCIRKLFSAAVISSWAFFRVDGQTYEHTGGGSCRG
jgi:hypothetical protein